MAHGHVRDWVARKFGETDPDAVLLSPWPILLSNRKGGVSGAEASGLTTKDARLEQRASNDVVDFLYAQSTSGRLTPTFCFIVIYLVFNAAVPWWSIIPVLAFQLGGTAICEVLRHFHRRLKPDEDRTRFAYGYAAASGICGISWGLTGLLWFIPGGPMQQLVVAILILAGVTGSVVSRSGYLPSLLTFLIGIGLPFIPALLYVGTPLSIAMAFMGLFYVVGSYGWARGLNRMYLREARARLFNEELVSELEVARDVAEARAEDAEQAQIAAEAGERAKSQFLSTISHEIRTPLNGIQGMAELLDGSDLSDDQRENLTIIRQSSDALRVLLEDVLEISRIDAGTQKLDIAEYQPAMVARQVADIMEPEARRKGLGIDVAVMPDVPTHASGDEKCCRQALLNIVGNAVKFTEHGRVTLRLSLEPAPDGGDSDVLRFAVRDTGPGIAADELGALFTEFAQIDQSMTRRHGGGGLGLALVKRLAQQMQGDVGVRSTLGEGAEFWFDVPVVIPEHRAAESQVAIASAALDPARIEALETVLGPEKALEIVEACLDTAWELTEAVEIARRDADVDAMARAAHDLKSAAGNVGLMALSDRAARISAAIRAGDTEDAFAEAARLPGETATAQDGLMRAYPPLAAAKAS
jgi:signal transduction histidine kinase/HPt (histidine-containing phosphotransfer) domain-containing protein